MIQAKQLGPLFTVVDITVAGEEALEPLLAKWRRLEISYRRFLLQVRGPTNEPDSRRPGRTGGEGPPKGRPGGLQTGGLGGEVLLSVLCGVLPAHIS